MKDFITMTLKAGAACLVSGLLMGAGINAGLALSSRFILNKELEENVEEQTEELDE